MQVPLAPGGDSRSKPTYCVRMLSPAALGTTQRSAVDYSMSSVPVGLSHAILAAQKQTSMKTLVFLVASAYQRVAVQNVLAAVNLKIFPGYWSVCADGERLGYGNTYPSLDGHQMTDALLWLGQVDVVKANWDCVRSFQRPSGLLPPAILPSMTGKKIGAGTLLATVAANGGLYEHWAPGSPLAALASPTYLQNADAIYRHTLDRKWLAA